MALRKDIKIPARDGYPLAATLFTPEGSSKGYIQIHCGTGIPRKLYANFAEFLADRGFTALTFDYRGVAESSPKNLKGFEALISDWGKLDMAGILDWAIQQFPNQKKYIAGHSMGGQMIGLMDNYQQIDKAFLIASSTGYWKDFNFPYKFVTLFFWYIMLPLHVRLYGFANARKLRQGENLPKGVALQWRSWCTNPDYFDYDFEHHLKPSFFDKIHYPIKAIQIADDPLANQITSNKFLKYFTNAPIEIQRIIPKELGVEKIGHTGFFSRRFKHNLWENFSKELLTS